MNIPIRTKQDDDVIYAPMETPDSFDTPSQDGSEYRSSDTTSDGLTDEELDESSEIPTIQDPSIFEEDGESEEQEVVDDEYSQVGDDNNEQEDDTVEQRDDEAYVSKEEYDLVVGQKEKLLAEWDNYRKRTAKEIATAKEQSNKNLIEAIIPTLDNFTMAIQHSDASANQDGMMTGFIAIYKSLLGSLAQEGLVIIRPEKGTPFDIEAHQAVMRDTESGLPSDTIASVVQDGYMFKDCVIRPAKVAVAV